MSKAKTKKPKAPEPHFQHLVSVFFRFCKEHYDSTPSFDSSGPRDFRLLIVAMRKKAEHSNVQWTEAIAERMLRVFLEFSWRDSWLRDNFLPFNLNRQKDKIFYRIKQYQISKQKQ